MASPHRSRSATTSKKDQSMRDTPTTPKSTKGYETAKSVERATYSKTFADTARRIGVDLPKK